MRAFGIPAGILAALLCLAEPAASMAPGELVFRNTFDDGGTVGDQTEAAAFLARATFGPTPQGTAELLQLGIDGWLDAQMALPPTLHRPRLESFTEIGQRERQVVWWDVSLTAPDQLRQRVALALSEILVVSDANGALEGQPRALAEYYDILLRGAFGNYRDLLEEVTLTPTMGHYLSMFRSTRYAEQGIEPDENYAREIMQLFSIGLVMLNPDGSVQTDGLGQPIPTYDQQDIIGLAEAFTGWVFAGAAGDDGDCQPWEWRWPAADWLSPMAPCVITSQNEGQPPDYHVTDAKTIVGGVVLPAGQTPEQDLTQALDTLFQHPNVGPFLATRLIQRLVTSNPSPGYVQRVAGVFADNGQGQRGDLGAMLRAILTDGEALDSYYQGKPDFGKLREPLLTITHLYRAFDAEVDPSYNNWPGLIYHAEDYLGQAALRSPSVFNFFKPGFAQPGPIQDAGLLSPEFQITNETQVVDHANIIFGMLVRTVNDANPTQLNTPWYSFYRIQIADLMPLADDPNALLAELDRRLTAGRMSDAMQQIIAARLADMTGGTLDQRRAYRVTEAIYYILTSPEYLVQK